MARKNNQNEEVKMTTPIEVIDGGVTEKRRPGRPRKNPLPVTQVQEVPAHAQHEEVVTEETSAEEKPKKRTKKEIIQNIPTELQLISTLGKDIKKALSSVNPSKQEIRFLVDEYYSIQTMRISVEGQIRAIDQEFDNAPEGTHAILDWNYMNLLTMEEGFKKALDAITESSNVGRWLKSVKGIGPVIAAGLLAYFEMSDKTTSYGKFHSYAGLNNNNRKWINNDTDARRLVDTAMNGEENINYDTLARLSLTTGWSVEYLESKAKQLKNGYYSKDSIIKAIKMIPWNKNLKVLCWKVGESFQKQNPDNSLYARIYRERKVYEEARNEEGYNAEYAANVLKEKNIGKDTVAYQYYSEGKIPPAQIIARAKRYAVKLFISHLFEMMYIDKWHKESPVPYPIVHLGHVDYIGPEVPYENFCDFEIAPRDTELRYGK